MPAGDRWPKYLVWTEFVDRFVFPSWTNRLVMLAGAGLGVAILYGALVYAYGTLPSTLNVGYSPQQPVPFSHKLHAGELKMDCRYCHSTVEKAGHAAVPATSTCIVCHSGKDVEGQTPYTAIHSESPRLLPVRRSYSTGEPVDWERVHDLADYVYFDHSIHVNRGVSCVECHGRIDKMEQVWQDKTLSMSFCLDCHRNPEPRLRPKEFITQLDWERPGDLESHLEQIHREYGEINASTTCSTCHR